MSNTPEAVGIQQAVDPSITTRPRDRVVQMLVKAANQMQEDPAGITSTDLEAPQQEVAALRSLVALATWRKGLGGGKIMNLCRCPPFYEQHRF